MSTKWRIKYIRKIKKSKKIKKIKKYEYKCSCGTWTNQYCRVCYTGHCNMCLITCSICDKKYDRGCVSAFHIETICDECECDFKGNWYYG